MATLTETAIITRRVIRYTIIGIIAYILLRIGLYYGVALYKYLNPPPPPPPTMGFGALPGLELPESIYDYDFVLETPTGSLPIFSDRATVFYMPYQRANLLALDQARQLAGKMGFLGEPVSVSTDTYEWKKLTPTPLTFSINIINGSFEINYAWQIDDSILLEKNFQGEIQTLNLVQQMMQNAELIHNDIDFTQGKITYHKAIGNKIIPAMSLSEADFVKVDFYRNLIDEIPVLTANPDKGIISVTYSGSSNPQKRIMAMNYNYFPIDYLSPETYPLKPVNQAWEELKNGQGYIANADENLKEVVVRRISLAYYDSPQAQQFLQPIYVFIGDDNFMAYVPAIHPNVLKSP